METCQIAQFFVPVLVWGPYSLGKSVEWKRVQLAYDFSVLLVPTR